MSRVIEIRPHRGGWQCWEGEGVCPYWLGPTAQAEVISYATERAKTGTAEIRWWTQRAIFSWALSLDPEVRGPTRGRRRGTPAKRKPFARL